MTGVREGGMAVERTSDARPLVTIHEAPTALGLIQQALELKIPAEQLKELMALQERMEDRNAAREFADAFAKFQQECPQVPRSSKAKIATRGGGGYEFTFAKRDEIDRTVRPHLVANGFSYSFDTTITEKMLTKVCTLRHRNGHFITSNATVPTESDGGMSPQQKFSSAGSFAERLSLSSVLGIVTTDSTPDEADDADTSVVTDDQATHLKDLCTEIGEKAAPRLCDWLKVATIPEVRAVDYERARAALQKTLDDRKVKKP